MRHLHTITKNNKKQCFWHIKKSKNLPKQKISFNIIIVPKVIYTGVWLNKHNDKLIKRLIKYVYEKYSIQIDEKQAEIYLDSLADFYIVVSKKSKKPKDAF